MLKVAGNTVYAMASKGSCAAVSWCEHATAYEIANKGKPWRYLLIPHDVIGDNTTLSGLIKQYTLVPAE